VTALFPRIDAPPVVRGDRFGILTVTAITVNGGGYGADVVWVWGETGER
jgi:hypothetical protein